jgi:hypothetical protein
MKIYSIATIISLSLFTSQSHSAAAARVAARKNRAQRFFLAIINLKKATEIQKTLYAVPKIGAQQIGNIRRARRLHLEELYRLNKIIIPSIVRVPAPDGFHIPLVIIPADAVISRSTSPSSSEKSSST